MKLRSAWVLWTLQVTSTPPYAAWTRQRTILTQAGCVEPMGLLGSPTEPDEGGCTDRRGGGSKAATILKSRPSMDQEDDNLHSAALMESQLQVAFRGLPARPQTIRATSHQGRMAYHPLHNGRCRRKCLRSSQGPWILSTPSLYQ